jgi:hypothetical protein
VNSIIVINKSGAESRCRTIADATTELKLAVIIRSILLSRMNLILLAAIFVLHGCASSSSRGGQVVAVEEGFSDGTGIPGEENFIVIEHVDGTTNRYIHWTTLGALVDLQDTVIQGQAIAMSGNSGNSTAPHLHFDVGDGPCTPHLDTSCRSLPVSFRNTSPHVNGLVEGQSYIAEQ